MNQTTQLQYTDAGGEPSTHTSHGAVVSTAAPRSMAGWHGGGAHRTQAPTPRSCEHTRPPSQRPPPLPTSQL